MSFILSCPFGCTVPLYKVQNLLSHIRLHHANEPHFIIQCSLQGCSRSFKKFETYRNHVYKFHSGSIFSDNSIDYRGVDDNHLHLSQSNDETCAESFEVSFDQDDQGSSINYTASLQRAAAIVLLKNRENHRLPLSVMDSIVTDFQSLFNECILLAQSEVSEILKKGNVDESVSADK
jgi:hypothetical protein